VDITGFTNLIFSESTARRYLLGFCWKNHQRFCPRCRERKLYHVSDGRRRCARCGYTFHDFSRRFLNACAFSPRQWLWFLKLFELMVPARDIAQQMGVTYATVLKAQDTVRRAVVAQALDARALYAAGVRPGPGRQGAAARDADSPVFGIIDINGYAICDVLSGLTAEDLLRFKLNFHLATSSVGNVVYTAPYRTYQTLVACGPSLWPSRLVRHEDKRIPAEAGGFWAFARRHLARLRGVDPAHFPLHLKELELRYNHREQNLVEMLAKALCGLVPDG